MNGIEPGYTIVFGDSADGETITGQIVEVSSDDGAHVVATWVPTGDDLDTTAEESQVKA